MAQHRECFAVIARICSDVIRWAEQIMAEIDRHWPAKDHAYHLRELGWEGRIKVPQSEYADSRLPNGHAAAIEACGGWQGTPHPRRDQRAWEPVWFN